MGQQQQGRAAGIRSSMRRPTEAKNLLSTAFDIWRSNNADKKGMEAFEKSFSAQGESRKRDMMSEEQARMAKADAAYEAALTSTGDPQVAKAYAQAVYTGLDVDIDELSPEADKPTESTRSRQERAQFLKENPEVVARIGQANADKFLLTGNWSAGGMKLSVGADGTITFSEDGSPVITGPTNTTKTRQQEKVATAEEGMRQLEYLASIADPNYLTLEGWTKAKFGRALDKAGMSENDLAEFNANRSAFVNQVLDDVMKFRKAITGVAGGEAEMKKIESMRANPNMGPAEFARAIEEQIKSAQRDRNTIQRLNGQEEIDWPDYKFQWGADSSAPPLPEGFVLE